MNNANEFFDQGYDAFVVGKLKSENPHQTESKKYSEWLFGWDLAQADMNEHQLNLDKRE